MKKHIPNFITSFNLFTGCAAVYLAFGGRYQYAFIAILIAAVFDFLDGFAARLLKAYSAMGKELDSLADMVSFGLAPGAIMFSMLTDSGLNRWFAMIAFLIPVFSGLRLAKFNIDERQVTSFLGLPTPANAIFMAGLAYSYSDLLVTNIGILIAITLLFSYLLVAEIPMFSLKFKNLSWKENKIQFLFLIGCLIILIIFQFNAFAPIIGWYIVLSAGIALFRK